MVAAGKQSMNGSRPKTIKLDKIRLDGDTQSRKELDEDVVKEYSDLMKDGVEFPPLGVVFDGTDYWLYDGFHRRFAAVKADMKEFRVIAINGTREDARWFSYSANITHGLKRKPGDIEKAVKAALKHPKGAKLSDTKIAEHVGVSVKTVSKYRGQLQSAMEIPEVTERIGRDGKTYSTEKIGRKPEKKPYIDPNGEEIRQYDSDGNKNANYKPQASVTGTHATSNGSPPDLPSVGTANRTESGSQGSGDAGECPPGEHVWTESDEDGEFCKSCKVSRVDVEGLPAVVPIDPNGFDSANIEEHNRTFAANFAAKVKAHNLEIERFARSIMEAFANPPTSVWLDESRLGIALDQIKSACATIRQAKAHDKPCPKCDGKGTITGKDCKRCKGVGYMPERTYEMAGGQ